MAVLLSGCKDEQATTVEPIRPVKILTIKDPARGVLRSLPGKVDAGEQVVLAFKIAGDLVELPVKESQQVTQGQLVARLDPHDLQLKLDDAEARHHKSEADFRRYQQLYKKGHVSEAQLEAAEADFKIKQAALATARSDLEHTRLRAPFSGQVSRRYVENFQRLQAKEPVIKIQDLSKIEIRINVPENIVAMAQQIRQMPEYQPMASFAALPGRSFEVTLKELSTVADPATQTYEAVYEMPAPQGITILPGMTAQISARIPTLLDLEKRDSYLIPAGSVYSDEQQQSAVFKVGEGHRLSKQLVEVAGLEGDSIRIAAGLAPGDRIVAAGVHFLREGQQVRLLTREGGL
ncbi:efflux RND transporter periplasmic adaptor subunit [Aestuariirhabdus litorea]|uniref:Efflux RND transporter periplasmic adaptor subunit n=1 Tax=Aestuariirhabdus litorea TaxID=2528527 RepID=A0A3P3VQ40_9GAMM|nr:efflux RND transporter periplasmic adaptor subunit [Aestuariirhabdus litorea]RRJ84564.1 efflux RND transporter periplasmic adaptor subunit [Aestuariirhabdus litorea]RWW97790.1 efflux RND transporter periplasmic adaptor subunit [Endozoicomonadaceae bacterium GTF-13]